MAEFIIFPVTKQIGKLSKTKFHVGSNMNMVTMGFGEIYLVTFENGKTAHIDEYEKRRHPIIEADDWKDLDYESIKVLYFS